MSIEEARKILGKLTSAKQTDSEVQKLVWDLEAIAKLTIRDMVAKSKEMLYNHSQDGETSLNEIPKSSRK